nr:bacillithiol system redox-active protein YtxJ [uncultured Flavobacterium sp.]
MSFFKNIFGQNDGADNENKPNIWNDLTEMSQLDEIIAESATQTVVIFKHSTRCIVSRTALKQFEYDFKADEKLKLYFLDLITYRPVSNEIADRFEVEHQSPQILVIKNGKAIYNTSHSAIDATILERFI